MDQGHCPRKGRSADATAAVAWACVRNVPGVPLEATAPGTARKREGDEAREGRAGRVRPLRSRDLGWDTASPDSKVYTSGTTRAMS